MKKNKKERKDHKSHFILHPYTFLDVLSSCKKPFSDTGGQRLADLVTTERCECQCQNNVFCLKWECVCVSRLHAYTCYVDLYCVHMILCVFVCLCIYCVDALKRKGWNLLLFRFARMYVKKRFEPNACLRRIAWLRLGHYVIFVYAYRSYWKMIRACLIKV